MRSYLYILLSSLSLGTPGQPPAGDSPEAGLAPKEGKPAQDRILTADDVTVLEKPARNMMNDFLRNLVDRKFADREPWLESLRTAGDWQRHAESIRKTMASWTGVFPPQTALNARVTGRIEWERYILEKILYESRPGFFVSAHLYLPKGQRSHRPAVLNVIGHSPAGKAAEEVQRRRYINRFA